MTAQHPKVIPESTRVWGRTPSGGPLWEWQERYPDGTVRTFHEIWTAVRVRSTMCYGGVQVANGPAPEQSKNSEPEKID